MKELGKRLRLAREQLGVSVEELAEATRIEPKYLLAMELGEFDKLPGPIYIRSYLRTYAIYLNLDPRGIVKLYQDQKQVVSEPLSRTTRIQREKKLQETEYRNQKQDFSRSSEKMVTMSRTAVRKQSRQKSHRKKSSNFSRVYNGLLIAGFLLLLVAAGVVIYLQSIS